MKIGWKKLGSGLRKIIGIASELTDNKILDGAENLIERLEIALPKPEPGQPGPDKAAIFDAVIPAIIQSDLTDLTADEEVEATAIIGDYRNHYVALRDEKEAFEASYDRAQAFIRRVKARKQEQPA